jgi:hypothetical protein
MKARRLCDRLVYALPTAPETFSSAADRKLAWTVLTVSYAFKIGSPLAPWARPA